MAHVGREEKGWEEMIESARVLDRGPKTGGLRQLRGAISLQSDLLPNYSKFFENRPIRGEKINIYRSTSLQCPKPD